MSPESNVQDKALTVTVAPPPAALAADKKKAEKKRSETDNLIDGHADTIKGAGKLTADQERALVRKQGRTGAGVGFVFLGLGAFLLLQRQGGLYALPAFLHPGSLVSRIWLAEGVTPKGNVTEAYQALANLPFFFGLSTKMIQFRIFVSLSAFFLAALVVFPGLFGKYWMKLGLALGFVMTRVILFVMFFGAFTPFSLMLKLFGRDPLRLAKHEGTYWVDRSGHKRASNHFEHLS